MANELRSVTTAVQDLAAGGAPPPSRYMLRDQDHHGGLSSADEMPEPIPLVDLSRLSSSAHEAAKLRSALQSWGLFLATNHGVEASLLSDMLRVGREFFLLPPEEKKKYSNLVDGKHFQNDGYGNDKVRSQDQRLDWLDRLHLTVEPEDERDVTLWPSRPESFRAIFNDYTSKTKKLRDRILREISKLLEIEADYFVNHVKDQAITFARLTCYPPCARPDLVFGIRPHSDGRLLTVILADKHVGGLQVQKDGKWYNVPNMPDTLLILLGDSMQIMSNGNFESSVHRVVTNAEKDRISLSVFYGVPCETMLEPVPSLLDKNRPARYKKMRSEDYIRRFHEYLSRGERFVDYMKI